MKAPRTPTVRYLHPKDVAQMLDVNTRTIDRWIIQGVIPPPIRIGKGSRGIRRWREDQIIAALDALRAQPA